MISASSDGPAKPEPTAYYSAAGMGQMAVRDIVEGIKRPDLWWGLAVFDIRQRFKRSMLGPIWLTLSMGIMVIAISLVFGTLFQHDMTALMPHIAIGLIFWGLITGCIVEACSAFTVAEGYLRNVPMPTSTHVLRALARNVIIFGFNLVIFVVIWLVYQRNVNANYLLIVPGFALFAANIAWISLALSIICTRYRDIPQIVASAIQVVFFVTPVFWSVESLPDRPAFVHLNPLYHMLEVVRAPLLGTAPSTESWGVLVVGLGVGVPFTLWLYRRVYARIAYWI